MRDVSPGSPRGTGPRLIATALGTALVLAAATFATHAPLAQSARPSPGATGGDGDGPPNFDIRIHKDDPRFAPASDITDYLEHYGAAPAAVSAVATNRVAGVATLEAALPGIVIEPSPVRLGVEIVSAMPGTPWLSPPADDRVTTLRAFLTRHAPAFGLSAAEVADLAVVADAVNPAGDMAWVELEQSFNGIPVFQGLLRGGFTARGELARTSGVVAAGIDPSLLATIPSLSGAQAVVRAAASVSWSVAEADLIERPSDIAQHRRYAAAGPMAREPDAWLVYFPIADGVARLAWATQIIGDPDAYLAVIDAETGTLLFRRNLTNYQTQTALYYVYMSDSPAPASPSPALPGANFQAPVVGRTPVSGVGNEGPFAFNTLGWMTDNVNGGDGHTDGNNVEAGMDLVAPDGVDAPVGGSGRVFNFAYNPAPGNPPPGQSPVLSTYRNGEAVNMFYWANRFHDAMYLLGFDEVSRNFQHNNFGRGGLGSDRVSAEGQDFAGTNNANFMTPVDGTRGRMQMYVFTAATAQNRSSGLDQEILIHELAHGLSNRLHNNASGLNTTMAQGLGEGWSDFYARALLASPDEDVDGIYALGAWATYQLEPADPTYSDNYYYGIRRFPYARRSTTGGPMNRPHNPLTFADIDPAQIDLTDGAYPRGPVGSSAAFQVHNIGEVWASALLEVRARFIDRLGFAAGNQRILQFVTNGMKLDPVDPTLLQARDAILAAANAGGGTAADIADIWMGFAMRGMGTGAQVTNAAIGTVVESFVTPGGALPTVTINDVATSEGDAGTTALTFTVGLPTLTALEARVSYRTVDGTAAGHATASNPTTMVVPGEGPASPYPSTITVSGAGVIQSLGVQLHDVSHGFAADLDVLLVGPGGQSVVLMSDAGASTPIVNASLLFRDGAPALSSPLVTGLYRPTNVGTGDAFPAPAPAGPYGDTLSVFNGTNANGVWSLYALDDFAADGGSIGGWSLLVTTAGMADYVAQAGELVFPPGTRSRSVTVLVNGDLTLEPDDTLAVNLFNPVNALISDGQGMGTILNDDTGMPTTVNDAYSTAFNTALIVPAPGVLANDAANGGGPISAALVAAPAGGTVALNANGSFTYTPNAGTVGQDSFSYRAVNGAGLGNVAVVTVLRQPPTTVQAPSGLRVQSVAGNLVTLRWDGPSIGPAPSGYVVEGGVSPGEVLASLPTGGSAPIFTFAAPTGSFVARVHALLGGQKSGASNEVPLHVNVPVAPSPPAALTGLVNGSTLSLAWRNTYAGGPPTGVVLDVTGSLSASLGLGLADHFTFGGVPGGTYTLRLRATNAGGSSVPSTPVTLTFPAACAGVPEPPANVLAYRVGTTVHVLWDSPATGHAATSYVLQVTGAFVGAFPTSGRALSGVVAPGTYHLSVVAANPCGASAATPMQVVVVPAS